jgi:predicted permease
MSWLEGTRARARLLFARRAAESRMEEEMRLHIELETERLIREDGLDAHEARRRAFVVFGGVENHKEALRSDRGFAWLGGASLDLKLGARMFVKYPGLTAVGVVGMAVAVAIAAVAFGIIGAIVDGELPLDEGHRIVAIRNVVDGQNNPGRLTHLHDLVTWRSELRAMSALGAYRTVDRNLITRDGRPEPVRIAEMTASGFRIARVPPLLGRYLVDDDERAGAPPVAVIGYSVWQSRFGGVADVVGKTLQLGATTHTVIGVMPDGFGFPINNRVWTPLRLDPTQFERGKAPAIDVFGRLAPNATLADAQLQLTTIARRLAVEYPKTRDRLRASVFPYKRAFIEGPEFVWVFHLVQALVTMILVVIGTNVAILVYARTATRSGEIAVRTALGASRGRIVAQLFAEALVLSGVAATVGIVGARFAFQQVNARLPQFGAEQIPFWLKFGVSPIIVSYVVGLAILGAVIVGVVPALKATRQRVSASLQQLSPGGGAGMRLGKTWTVLIVAQVAIAVTILPITLDGIAKLISHQLAKPALATQEFVTAPLLLDREGPGTDDIDVADAAFANRYAALETELVRRLEAESGVSEVVLANAVPGDEPKMRIDVDGATGAASAAGHEVSVGHVDLDYFDAFDVPVLVGRPFRAADAAPNATTVIVNRSFVQSVLGGRDALGRRIRAAVRADERGQVAQNEPWLEIVGVVPDLPTIAEGRPPEPRIYHALVRSAVYPVTLAVRVRGGPAASFNDRLRALTVAVDPMLRLGDIGTIEGTQQLERAFDKAIFGAFALLTLSVLLLSAAGVYALMSFTIARRRREIGIRAALGAGPRSVLTSVLSRAATQIGLGIAVGVTAVVIVMSVGDGVSVRRGVLLLAVAVLMTIIGMAAALGPVRRALAIPPTEALRAE